MEILEIKEKLIEKYGENDNRYKHIIGVYNLATKLAIKYNVDVRKAQIAALLHDYYKKESVEEMCRVIDDTYIIEKYKNNTAIYHAYASGAALKKEFHIDDEEIYKAIVHHVYGAMNMSRLEEIILISDYCEENRTYPSCVEVRGILEKSLNKAIFMCLDYTLKFLEKKGVKPLSEQFDICEQYRGKED